jgi:hypothetical protein
MQMDIKKVNVDILIKWSQYFLLDRNRGTRYRLFTYNNVIIRSQKTTLKKKYQEAV